MMHILLAYAASWFGGFFWVGACMWLMRKVVGDGEAGGDKYKSFRILDLLVGGTERLVATTLVWFAPTYLASFIGGWTALKFAANWKRQSSDDDWVSTGSLLFLIGSVLSFAVAIGSGLYLNPEALTVWAEQ
jgi:hypothetical protein